MRAVFLIIAISAEKECGEKKGEEKNNGETFIYFGISNRSL